MLSGSCLCGSVTFRVKGKIPAPSVCHCGQCRKQSGHVWASSFVPEDRLSIITSDTLRWFEITPSARRGFCGNCGSFLFWQHYDDDGISFSMGAADTPTGLKIGRHIFVADKGDYYEINDGLPQQDQ